MTTYYYEIPEKEGMRYVSAVAGVWISRADANYLNNQALRIWCESGQRVTYNKLSSQWVSDMGQVDMREFMWVKLCAKPLSKE